MLDDATIFLTLPMSRSLRGSEATCVLRVSAELLDDGGLDVAVEEAVEGWRTGCREQHGADLLPTDGNWRIADLTEMVEFTGRRVLRGHVVHERAAS